MSREMLSLYYFYSYVLNLNTLMLTEDDYDDCKFWDLHTPYKWLTVWYKLYWTNAK